LKKYLPESLSQYLKQNHMAVRLNIQIRSRSWGYNGMR
jgi:hypothetical protein